jgi:hypothetical protein
MLFFTFGPSLLVYQLHSCLNVFFLVLCMVLVCLHVIFLSCVGHIDNPLYTLQFCCID